MKWQFMASAVLATIVAGLSAPAQDASGEPALSTALQSAFDRSVVDQGFDPRSSDIGGVRGQMIGLARDLAGKEDAIKKAQVKIKSLRSDLEVDKDELDRLQTQMAQEMANCRADEEALLTEAQIHNAKPHVFKIPQQAAALAAYDAEVGVHEAKVAALVKREEAIKNGDEARRVDSLIEKCNTAGRDIDDLETRMTADEKDLHDMYEHDLEKIATLLNSLQLQHGLSSPHHPGGEAFAQLLDANNRSNGALGRSLDRMPNASGAPFDGRQPSAPGQGIQGGAVPGEVAGNANYQWRVSEQKSLEAQIAAIKANVVFNPKATPQERGAALKQMSDLDSRRIGLGFQMGAMTAPTSLPLARPRLKPMEVPSPSANQAGVP